MGESDTKHRSRVFRWTVRLLGLTAVYLLSFGPAHGLLSRGVISGATWTTLLNTVYLPLKWLIELSDEFLFLLAWYCSLFAP